MRIRLGVISLLFLADLGRAQGRDIEVSSFDGTRVAATYFDPGKPGPGVIIFRNCDAQRTQVAAAAQRLAARGYHILTWDYRSGASTGRTWREGRADDADALHQWLIGRAGVDARNLGVIGGSCGVATALDFAMRHEADVKAALLLSGPSYEDQRAFLSRARGIAVFGGSSSGEGAAAGYMQAAVSSSRHAGSRVLVVPGEGHGTRLLDDAGFEPTALEWLVRHLPTASRR